MLCPRRHLCGDSAVQRKISPVAVRDLPVTAVFAAIAALSVAPPNPVAFVQIVGGAENVPQALRDGIVTNLTPPALVASTPTLRAAS